jgi:hypothetical protein
LEQKGKGACSSAILHSGLFLNDRHLKKWIEKGKERGNLIELGEVGLLSDQSEVSWGK